MKRQWKHFTSVLSSEGIFVAFRNVILPSVPKTVILNFIISSAFASCGSSTKNSVLSLDSSVFRMMSWYSQQTPRITNKLWFWVGGSIMNLAIFIYLACLNPLKWYIFYCSKYPHLWPVGAPSDWLLCHFVVALIVLIVLGLFCTYSAPDLD